MGKIFETDREKRCWSDIRHTDSRKVRNKFEELLAPFFDKYQEHMLVPVSGTIPKLKEPALFYKVLKEFPLDILITAKALQISGGVIHTPCAETLLEIDWHFPEPNEYHPSVSVMEELFWGNYLYLLAKDKGYKTQWKEDPLRQLVADGWNALEGGRTIFPLRR